MKQLRPTQEELAARAYEIYGKNGSQSGHDRDDWLQSEYELMHLPLRMLAAVIPPRTQPRDSQRKSIRDLVRAKWFTPWRAVPIHGPLPSAAFR
jgi:hypothetical protein